MFRLEHGNREEETIRRYEQKADSRINGVEGKKQKMNEATQKSKSMEVQEVGDAKPFVKVGQVEPGQGR